jgi:hypothetical protein
MLRYRASPMLCLHTHTHTLMCCTYIFCSWTLSVRTDHSCKNLPSHHLQRDLQHPHPPTNPDLSQIHRAGYARCDSSAVAVCSRPLQRGAQELAPLGGSLVERGKRRVPAGALVRGGQQGSIVPPASPHPPLRDGAWPLRALRGTPSPARRLLKKQGTQQQARPRADSEGSKGQSNRPLLS